MLDAEYGGGALPQPIGVGITRRWIQAGPSSGFAVPTYSGNVVYEQSVRFTAEELERRTALDLSQVRGCARERCGTIGYGHE